MNRGDFQVSLGGWSGLLDTDSNAWSFLHSGGALNFAHYASPKVDALLDQARVEGDIPARRGLYSQVWRQVSSDLPLIYLWTPKNLVGMRKQLTGFVQVPDGLIRLTGVSLAP